MITKSTNIQICNVELALYSPGVFVCKYALSYRIYVFILFYMNTFSYQYTFFRPSSVFCLIACLLLSAIPESPRSILISYVTCWTKTISTASLVVMSCAHGPLLFSCLFTYRSIRVYERKLKNPTCKRKSSSDFFWKLSIWSTPVVPS